MVASLVVRSPVASIGIRYFAAAAAALGAVLSAVGALGTRWWVAGDAFGIGPRGLSLCATEGCTSRALSDLGAGTETWAKLGLATFAAGCAAALLLLIMAGLYVAGRRMRRSPFVVAGVCLFAAILGGTFVLYFTGFEGVRPGVQMGLFFLGTALGVGSAGLCAGSGNRPN